MSPPPPPLPTVARRRRHLRRTATRLLLAMAAVLLPPGGAIAAGPAPAPRAEQAAHAADPLQVPDTLAQRALACTGCHGRQGRSTPEGYVPRLAGKPAGYLAAQLRAFRDGRRQQGAMARLLAHLDDDYLAELAGYFAGLQLPYPPPAPLRGSVDARARGERLVREGDPARDLPACTGCHGASMTGVQPAVPGLLGLPRDYLVAQLGAWRQGIRHAPAPDCMATLARRLAPQDINDVADWLAAQPLPPDTRPQAPAAGPLPLPCGSVAP